MADENRLSHALAQGIPLWEPERRLAQISQEEVRFSRGFLRCDVPKLIDGFAERWLPLLLSLDATVQLRRCTTTLGPPDALEFQAFISVDEELATLGFDRQTLETFSALVLDQSDSAASIILVEYLARRFVSCLQKTLAFDPIPQLKFVSNPPRVGEPSIATIDVEFTLNDHRCRMLLGLGSKAVEQIDAVWRKHVTRQTISRGVQYSDQLHNVSIELAELAVEPAVLIDYVRSGTVIDLESPLGSPVVVRLNESPWFIGSLAIFRGCFAVRVDSLNVEAQRVEDSKTRVRVELARFQLDQEGVLENQQKGSILATRSPAASTANLIIGGEQVATASVHEVGGRYALTVLPR